MSLNDVLSAIDSEITRIEQARNLLAEFGATKRSKKSATARPGRTKRTMSAEGRKRIAAAQRKRWAAKRKAEK